MTKKAKVVKKKEQLTLENISVGDILPNHHGEEIEITDDLIEQMRTFEKANPKSHSVWKNKITGTFLYYKYYEDHPQEKKEKKKPSKKPKAKAEEIEVEEDEEELDQKDEEELDDEEELEDIDFDELEEEDEENLLKDCIADYKAEYNVKKVNTNTKKFKAFFEKWKQSE